MRRIGKQRFLSLVLSGCLLWGAFAGNMTGMRQVEAAEGDVEISEEAFPDEAFRDFVSEEYDLNKDGVLSEEELKQSKATFINESLTEVKNMKGIELFRYTSSISIKAPELEELDVSSMTRLDSLTINGCKNPDVAVTLNENLTSYNCSGCSFQKLDVSGWTGLQSLNCSGNQLSELDISQNPELIILNCIGNDENMKLISNGKLQLLKADTGTLNQLDPDEIPNIELKANVLVIREEKKLILDLSTIEDYDTKIVDHKIYYTPDGAYSPTSVVFEGSKLEIPLYDNSFYDDWNGGYHCYYQYTPSKQVKMNFVFTSIESPLSVSYSAHMQGVGWQDYSENGCVAGVLEESKRMEALKIKTTGNVNLGVEYTAYVEAYGWQEWVEDDTVCGTVGEGKRLEAVKIRLNGYDADRNKQYDIYYRVKCEGYGWLGWAKNGETAGTIGYSKKIEAIQIVILEKNDDAPTEIDGIVSAISDASMQKEEQDNWGDIPIDEKNFPDATFRRVVKGQADKNHDDILSVDEARSLTKLSLAYSLGQAELYSLKGIEYFGALRILHCNNYNIKELDLSHNTELVELNCSGNCLTELNLSKNRKLETVNCANNQIASLTVGATNSLKTLYCYNNRVKELDVSEAAELTSLNCGTNPLVELKLNENIKALGYSECPELKINPADYPGLEEIDCSGNNLTELDLSNNQNLIRLTCTDNMLEELNLSANEHLTELRCSNNQLRELHLNDNMNLKIVSSYKNKIQTLLPEGLKVEEFLWVDLENLKSFQIEQTSSVCTYSNCPTKMTEAGFEVDLSCLEDWETKIKRICYDFVDSNGHKRYEDYTGYEIANNVKNGNLTVPLTTLEDSLRCDYQYSDSKSITMYLNFDKPEAKGVKVIYRTHVQGIGWQEPVSDGKVSGTSGQSKRLEAIEIELETDEDVNIQYTTHCQNYGWLPWALNGELSGTEGESKRLEAIAIKLSGKDAYKYDVYYRVHAQGFGWFEWACNGGWSGTLGASKRLEAIQIVVVKKGEKVSEVLEGIKSNTPGWTCKDFRKSWNTTRPIASETVNVAVKTHVQNYGWQGWRYNGQLAGTSGESKRLESICLKLTNCPYEGDIEYRTHVQNYGWMSWKKNGEMAGTSGESKRLEAIQIRLTDEMAEKYDVYYRVHAQKFGWLGWAKNGEMAGTAGYSYRLEAIQVVLVEKGKAAPGMWVDFIKGPIDAAAYLQK